jgi:ribosomal protein S21
MDTMPDISDEERGLGSKSRLVERSPIWKVVTNFFEKDESEIEKTIKKFNQQLEKAQKLTELYLDYYSTLEAKDDKVLKTLTKASDYVKNATELINKSFEIKEDITLALKFINAVNEVSKVDIEKDPNKAAKAFGKLFETVGKFGKFVPGPFKYYFEFLENAGTFFEDVTRGLIPGLRENIKMQREQLDLEHRSLLE